MKKIYLSLLFISLTFSCKSASPELHDSGSESEPEVVALSPADIENLFTEYDRTKALARKRKPSQAPISVTAEATKVVAEVVVGDKRAPSTTIIEIPAPRKDAVATAPSHTGSIATATLTVAIIFYAVINALNKKQTS